MDYPSCDSFIRLTTGYRRSDVVRFARRTMDQLLVLFTRSILISGVTILNLPIDLLHFEEITHGANSPTPNGIPSWIRGSRHPNDF